MKKNLFILVLCSILLLLAPMASACTSFAVYGESGPIYGMNFDNTDRDYRLRYDLPDGYNGAFSVHYMWYGADAFTPMINDKGFFSAVQAHAPDEKYTFQFSENDEALASLAMWTPYVFSRVEDVRNIAETTPIQHIYGSFHTLYADASGDAMIMEVLDGKTICTDIEGNYIVMTNFPVALIENTPWETLENIPYGGTDRYQIVDMYIQEHANSFGVEEALTALELARNIITAPPPIPWCSILLPKKYTSPSRVILITSGAWIWKPSVLKPSEDLESPFPWISVKKALA